MRVEKKDFALILADAQAAGFEGDDVLTALKALWFSPSVRVLFSHRIQKRLRAEGGMWRTALARMLWMRSLSKWGCDIGNQAEIAPGVVIWHMAGVVIGNGVRIEPGVQIFQHVTLGDKNNDALDIHRPVVRAGAVIYAGASILGDVEIGERAVIGAHALVQENVPAGGVAYGPRAQIKAPKTVKRSKTVNSGKAAQKKKAAAKAPSKNTAKTGSKTKRARKAKKSAA